MTLGLIFHPRLFVESPIASLSDPTCGLDVVIGGFSILLTE